MDKNDLKTLFRKQVADVNKPYLWDDIEVDQYMTDAQDMFVRLTGGIADFSTQDIVEVPVDEGEPMSAHSQYILRILSARLVDAERDLKIVDPSNIADAVDMDYGFQTPSSLRDDDTGPVTAMVLGLEDNAIRWYRVPVVSDICKLHVRRLPYPRDAECLEIDDMHHIHLLKWMKHMAYNKEDAETYDKSLADKNEALFRSYCADAKVEQEGKRYKVRTVRYGGL